MFLFFFFIKSTTSSASLWLTSFNSLTKKKHKCFCVRSKQTPLLYLTTHTHARTHGSFGHTHCVVSAYNGLFNQPCRSEMLRADILYLTGMSLKPEHYYSATPSSCFHSVCVLSSVTMGCFLNSS